MGINDDLGILVGTLQRKELIKQQKKTNALLEKQTEETARIKALPKCPSCASSLELQAKICKECSQSIFITEFFSIVVQGREVFLQDSPEEFFSRMEKHFSEAQTKIIQKPSELLGGIPSLVDAIIKVSGPNSSIQEDLKNQNILKAPKGRHPIAMGILAFAATCGFSGIFHALFGSSSALFSLVPEDMFVTYAFFAFMLLPVFVSVCTGFYLSKLENDSEYLHREKLQTLNLQLDTIRKKYLLPNEKYIKRGLKSFQKLRSGFKTLEAKKKVLEHEHAYLKELADQFEMSFEGVLKEYPDNIFEKYDLAAKLPSGSNTREWFQTSEDLPKELKEILSSLDTILLSHNSLNTNNEPVEDITSEKASYFIKLPNNKVKGPYSKPQITEAIKNKKIPLGCSYSNLKDGPWKELKIS